MYAVALLAQKGGVGKTTLAVSLAVQAELAGFRAGIVDADPQANASGWLKRRKKAQGKATPSVAAVTDVATLREAVQSAKADKLDWLFFDTQPGVSELPAAVASLANLLVIPCLGTANTLDALASTVRLVKRVKKPAFFVLNRARSSKAINDACAVALSSAYGLPVVNAYISQRLVIGDLEEDGTALPELESQDSTTERGKEEFRTLWQWLVQQKEKRHHA